jgi:hypothetical protein
VGIKCWPLRIVCNRTLIWMPLLCHAEHAYMCGFAMQVQLMLSINHPNVVGTAGALLRTATAAIAAVAACRISMCRMPVAKTHVHTCCRCWLLARDMLAVVGLRRVVCRCAPTTTSPTPARQCSPTPACPVGEAACQPSSCTRSSPAASLALQGAARPHSAAAHWRRCAQQLVRQQPQRSSRVMQRTSKLQSSAR